MKLKSILQSHRLPMNMTEEDYVSLEQEWNECSELAPLRDSAINQNLIKKGIVGGVKYDSQWEYAYHLFSRDIKGFMIERNSVEHLPYTNKDGMPAKWYPDFIENGIYVEVKGRLRENDICKKDQYNSVKWVGAEEMKPILTQVYKRFPNWKTNYIER